MFSFICSISGHKIDRRYVWYDQMNYRGHCQRCERPLIKEHGVWKEFSSERHAHEARKPHPKFDDE